MTNPGLKFNENSTLNIAKRKLSKKILFLNGSIYKDLQWVCYAKFCTKTVPF